MTSPGSAPAPGPERPASVSRPRFRELGQSRVGVRERRGELAVSLPRDVRASRRSRCPSESQYRSRAIWIALQAPLEPLNGFGEAPRLGQQLAEHFGCGLDGLGQTNRQRQIELRSRRGRSVATPSSVRPAAIAIAAASSRSMMTMAGRRSPSSLACALREAACGRGRRQMCVRGAPCSVRPRTDR